MKIEAGCQGRETLGKSADADARAKKCKEVVRRSRCAVQHSRITLGSFYLFIYFIYFVTVVSHRRLRASGFAEKLLPFLPQTGGPSLIPLSSPEKLTVQISRDVIRK